MSVLRQILHFGKYFPLTVTICYFGDKLHTKRLNKLLLEI